MLQKLYLKIYLQQCLKLDVGLNKIYMHPIFFLVCVCVCVCCVCVCVLCVCCVCVCVCVCVCASLYVCVCVRLILNVAGGEFKCICKDER